MLPAMPGAGRQSPDRIGLPSAALGIGAQVMFAGFASESELIGFYRAGAVFAMPSRNEGFGLVYLEAMSHGLPCIACVDDAAGEVVEDGQTGFLIRQEDRAALTERIVRLLADPPLRRQMGAAGQRRLQERFSYDRFARTMLSLMEEAPSGLAAWSADAAH